MSAATIGALQQLALQAGAMSMQTIPESVRNQARLCILDTVGCILAGSRTEEAQLVLACEPGGSSEAVSVLGTPHRRALREAMRINGYLGDVLELNDLIGGHASIGIVSAALALGEALGSSGSRALEAVVRGIEVTSRVYDAVYLTLRRYTEMALVPVGIPSSIGAAAAAAHLLDLGEEQTLNALAIAGGLAGWCPAEVIFGNGGTFKPMLFGAQPADAGVTAAYYARAGMTGPRDLLDSKVGYFATVATDGRFDPAGWTGRWALAQPRRKLHACCGYLHAPVDALGKLRQRLGQDALQQSRIEVRVAPYVADVVSKERLPSSPNDARFHLQYCLAVVACGADVLLPEHSIQFAEQLQHAEVLDAMRRIAVVQDAGLAHYHHCRVEIVDAAGRSSSQSVSAPRGSPQDALSDDEVIGKFRMLAEPVLGPERTRRAIADCLALEDMADVRELLASLSTSTKGAHS